MTALEGGFDGAAALEGAGEPLSHQVAASGFDSEGRGAALSPTAWIGSLQMGQKSGASGSGSEKETI